MNHFELTKWVRSTIQDFLNIDVDYKLLLEWKLIKLKNKNLHVDYSYDIDTETIFIHIPRLSTYIFEHLIDDEWDNLDDAREIEIKEMPTQLYPINS